MINRVCREQSQDKICPALLIKPEAMNTETIQILEVSDY